MVVAVSGEFEYRGMKAFTNCCVQRQKLFKLKRLNLSRNQLGRKGFQFVASIIQGNATVADLILRDCGLDAGNIDVLAEALDKSKGLVLLDIASNAGIAAEGGRLLARCLGHCKRIKSVDLSMCRLGPEGMKALCDSLQRNMSITQLSLNNNDCKDAGAVAVGSLLTHNNTLTHIDLQANKISSAGIRALCEGLKENRSVVCIALQWNEIDNVGAVHVVEALKANLETHGGSCSLKALFIFGNRIDEMHAGLMAASVCYNHANVCVNPTPLELDVPYIKMKAPTPIVKQTNSTDQSDVVDESEYQEDDEE